MEYLKTLSAQRFYKQPGKRHLIDLQIQIYSPDVRFLKEEGKKLWENEKYKFNNLEIYDGTSGEVFVDKYREFEP